MGTPKYDRQKCSETILARMVDGTPRRSLNSICEGDDSLPKASTFCGWLAEDPELAEKYARARFAMVVMMETEVMEIANDGTNDFYKRKGENGKEWWEFRGEHVQRSKLRVDTIKFFLMKIMPRIYGPPDAAVVNAPTINFNFVAPAVRDPRQIAATNGTNGLPAGDGDEK